MTSQPLPATRLHAAAPRAAATQALLPCRQCQQWENGPDDIYCGFCGFLLLALEVDGGPVTLISVLAPAKEVVFRNTGIHPMQVVIARASDAGGAAITVEPSGPFDIPANGSVGVRFTLDGAQLPAGFTERRLDYVCIVNDDGRKQRPLQVIVRSGPRPKVFTPVLDFGNVEERQTVRQALEIGNTGGTPLRITEVKPEGAAELRLDEPFRETVLKPSEKLAVSVLWEGRTDAAAAETPTGVRIRFANYPETIFVPAQARTFRYLLTLTPPAVRFSRALAKRDHIEQVRLENGGSTDVEIAGIESDQPWISIISRTSAFTLLCSQSVQQRSGVLPPTTYARVFDFRVACRPKGLEAGKHHGSVTIRAHGQRPLTLQVEMEVVQPRVYQDYIGIDFGTTNSVVAVLNHKTREVELVQDELSRSHLIPSVLVFDDAETYKIGQAAKNEADIAPDRTVRSIKRIMGYNHERRFFDRTFSAGALASRIIRKLVEMAEQKLFHDSGTYFEVGRAIITVPANFFDLQIREVLDACREAGLDIEEERARRVTERMRETVGKAVNAGVILDEPSAAVLYYIDYLRRHRNTAEITQAINSERGLRLLVFDYGGGTLDVSVAVIQREAGATGLRILANVGDNGIGGDSIDLILMKDLLKRCAEKASDFDFDLALIADNFRELEARGDREGWSAAIWREVLRVRSAWKDTAEAAKRRLAEQEQTDVEIKPDMIVRLTNGKVLSASRTVKLTHFKRTSLDDLLQPVLKKCAQSIDAALDLAHIDRKDVDYILHTGRQSLLPAIRQHVRGLFPHLRSDRDLLEEAHLKICVAKGAALYGAMRDKPVSPEARIHFFDEGRSLPHSYGVETYKNPLEAELDVIIPRGSKYPTEATRHYGPEMIGDSGYLNLRFFQNTGTIARIAGNPQISLIGEISIDTIADGQPGCDIRFVIGANRTLEVFADGASVPIQRASLQDEEGWVG